MKGQKLSFPTLPNQDTFLVVPVSWDTMVAAVLDGHGLNGHIASARVRVLLEQQAESLCSQAPSTLEASLTKLFVSIQETLDREGLSEMCGSTCTLALLDGARQAITIAHVGDSKLMILAGSKIEHESRDHVIDDEAERHINACGGEVRTETYSSVTARRVFERGGEYPGLSMARALGDAEGRRVGVRCEPEVHTVPFCPGSELIIASDGIWEKIPPHTVASLVNAASSTQSSPTLAAMLVAEARRLWPADQDIDDITAVVVRDGASAGAPLWAVPAGA